MWHGRTFKKCEGDYRRANRSASGAAGQRLGGVPAASLSTLSKYVRAYTPCLAGTTGPGWRSSSVWRPFSRRCVVPIDPAYHARQASHLPRIASGWVGSMGGEALPRCGLVERAALVGQWVRELRRRQHPGPNLEVRRRGSDEIPCGLRVRVDKDAGKSQLSDHHPDGFDQISVVGNHSCDVESAPKAVKQKIGSKVYVGTLLLRLMDLYKSWNGRVRTCRSRCNYALTKRSEVDRKVRYGTQGTEVHLLADMHVSVIRPRLCPGCKVLGCQYVMCWQEVPKERAQITPFVRRTPDGSVVEVEPIDVDVRSGRHSSHGRRRSLRNAEAAQLGGFAPCRRSNRGIEIQRLRCLGRRQDPRDRFLSSQASTPAPYTSVPHLPLTPSPPRS